MACLGNCPYCGGSVVNAEFHEKCRRQYLEDLLLQLQEIWKVKGKRVPKSLKKKILDLQNLKSLKQIRREEIDKMKEETGIDLAPQGPGSEIVVNTQ